MLCFPMALLNEADGTLVAHQAFGVQDRTRQDRLYKTENTSIRRLLDGRGLFEKMGVCLMAKNESESAKQTF